MATLQKFKLLATQCAIAGSPTRSPTTSPVIHLRRRKTLRMLLSRTSGSGRRLFRREESPDRQEVVPDSPPPEKSKELLSRTLKDLFISSPPPQELQQQDNLNKATEKIRGSDLEAFPSSTINRGDGSMSRRFSVGLYRYRLSRRLWRPILNAIPESNETPQHPDSHSQSRSL